MNRLLAFALVISIGNASAAFAGESILTSATRHAKAIAAADVTTAAPATTLPSGVVVASGITAPAAFQAQGGNLSRSGMSKGKKAMIYIGLAVGFAASVWTIDHKVLDVTPSSLGTRKD